MADHPGNRCHPFRHRRASISLFSVIPYPDATSQGRPVPPLMAAQPKFGANSRQRRSLLCLPLPTEHTSANRPAERQISRDHRGEAYQPPTNFNTGGKLQHLPSRVLEAVEGLPSASSRVLLRAVEPEPFQHLVFEQRADGVGSGPIQRSFDEVLLRAGGPYHCRDGGHPYRIGETLGLAVLTTAAAVETSDLAVLTTAATVETSDLAVLTTAATVEASIWRCSSPPRRWRRRIWRCLPPPRRWRRRTWRCYHRRPKTSPKTKCHPFRPSPLRLWHADLTGAAPLVPRTLEVCASQALIRRGSVPACFWAGLERRSKK